jgi:nucleoside-diphosphate-sugar epimerase
MSPAGRIVVTGAAGRIGRVLRERLPASYELGALDLEPVLDPRLDAAEVADVADLEAIVPAFAGASTVVHLAAVGGIDEPFSRIAPTNLAGTWNVFEAARRQGVKRVVFASSNHVVGCYEQDAPYAEVVAGRLIPGPGFPFLDHRAAIRPDSAYGSSKAFGEAVARQFWERDGIEAICLRIGTVTGSGLPEEVRHRATWLSHRDLAALVSCCLEAPAVGFAIFYGVSANRRRFWDIRESEHRVGYRPLDDAETCAGPLPGE